MRDGFSLHGRRYGYSNGCRKNVNSDISGSCPSGRRITLTNSPI
ncbi:MAG: hypothetical protein F4Y78_07275 [Candidatus Dadabacteria bacterium]|nr:hypothetical protein [Candidatus Dadabacteria bacterium]MYA48102.1 hypothetical protein [Candidatus Dadabacteria bacterium]MYF48094.1 hypothetical protein [Candidatus Dadabacteria bacterium]MYG83644.1 hypothetical protein [Candidatus Dadabacteria bacterium]MYK49614.1 hypothetical protein [Candidatus Dadabacteria bacterium]